MQSNELLRNNFTLLCKQGMMQSNESCLWKQFLQSEQDQQQQDHETVKSKKAPPSGRGLNTYIKQTCVTY